MTPPFPTGSLLPLHGRNRCPWDLGVLSITLFSTQNGPVAARRPSGCQKNLWPPRIQIRPARCVAGRQASPFPAHPVTSDHGGPGLEIHLQGGLRA